VLRVLVALDPWFLELREDGETHLRLAAFEQLRALLAEQPDLELLPCLGGDFWMSLMSPSAEAGYKESPLTRHPFLFEFLNKLSGEPSGPVAQLPGVAEANNAPDAWRRAVGSAVDSDNSPQWRDPVFVYPQHRSKTWPGPEVCVHANCKIVWRVAVSVTDYGQHRYFLSDLDPWLCDRHRDGKEESEKGCSRILPRPVELHRVRMCKWDEILEEIDTSQNKEGAILPYVPPADWRHCLLTKDHWRRESFPYATKRSQNKKGPRDRRDRVWAWDDAEHHTHWDVQHADERNSAYMNVNSAGTITKAE